MKTKESNILKDETLAEKFIKKGFWLYLFTFLAAPFGYLVKLLISNSLPVDEVGIIYSTLGLFALISIYNDLGFTESLNYFLPKFRLKKQYGKFKSSIFFALFLQTISAIILSILLYLNAQWLAIHYFHSAKAEIVLKISSILFIFYNLINAFNTVFNSFQDTKSGNLIGFIRIFSVFILVLYFFVHNPSLKNYTIARTAGIIVAVIFAVLLFTKKYSFILKKGKFKIEKSLVKEIFKYAIRVVLAAQGALILGLIDQQIAIFMLGPKAAGFYTNYLSLINTPLMLIGPIFGFLFPVTSELIEKKQHEKLKSIIQIFYKYFSVILLFAGSFLAIWGKELVISLLGEKFLFSSELLMLGGRFIIFRGLNNINFSMLAGLGKIKQRAKILRIVAIWNLIGDIFGAIFFKLRGIVGVTIIGWILIFILSKRELVKSIGKIKIDIFFILKNLLIIITILYVTKYVGNSRVITGNRYEIFGKLIIIGISSGFLLILFNLKEFNLFVKTIKNVLNNLPPTSG